jgi:hypothetical protein
MAQPGWEQRDPADSKRLLVMRQRPTRQRFEATIASAQMALRTAVLINGAGAIVLLVLFAQAFKDPSVLPGASQLAAATLWLVAGTALAGCATGVAFLAHYGHLMRWHTWFGRGGRAVTITQLIIGLVFSSYVCFLIAALYIYWALSGPMHGGVFARPETMTRQLLQWAGALAGVIATIPEFSEFSAAEGPLLRSHGQAWWNAWAALATGVAVLLEALASML